MPTAGIACPWCCGAIKAAGLSAGSRVQCPRCHKAFTLRPEDLRAAALTAAPAPVAAPRPPVRSRAAPPPPADGLPPWFLPLGAAAVGVLVLVAAGVILILHFSAKAPPLQAAAPPPPAPVFVPQPDPTPVPTDPGVGRTPLQDDPPPRPPRPKPIDVPPPVLPPPLNTDPGPATPQPSGLTPDQDAKVKKAIERGVAFLKASQQEDGSWVYGGSNQVGATALPGLTLLESGIAPDEAHVRKAVQFVRDNTDSLTETYELALAILFLDRLGDVKDEPLIRTLALRLIAGETPAGGWTYACPVVSADDEPILLAYLRNNRPSTVLELVSPRTGDPRPPRPEPADDGPKALLALPDTLRDLPALQTIPADEAFPTTDGSDNSCTQFAILGLWTARRHDVPMERALARVNKRFRVSQAEAGGWDYSFSNPPDGGATPSMTAAGLLGLAVGHGVTADLKGDDPAKTGGDQAVEKGMKALSESIGDALGDKKGDTVLPLQDLYFLWSVERVGVLYNRRTVADKEWYPWGAEVLLDNQQENGSWQHNYSGPLDTSFALLFLKRANLASDLSTKLQFLTQIKK